MMTLDELRSIVKRNMPYDTGFMFMFGNRFNETNQYILAFYDSTAVPYIVYNEKGMNNNPNKGFISTKTINELNRVLAMNQNDKNTYMAGAQQANSTNSSLVSNGVMEYLKDYQEVAGLTYEHYTG